MDVSEDLPVHSGHQDARLQAWMCVSRPWAIYFPKRHLLGVKATTLLVISPFTTSGRTVSRDPILPVSPG